MNTWLGWCAGAVAGANGQLPALWWCFYEPGLHEHGEVCLDVACTQLHAASAQPRHRLVSLPRPLPPCTHTNTLAHAFMRVQLTRPAAQCDNQAQPRREHGESNGSAPVAKRGRSHPAAQCDAGERKGPHVFSRGSLVRPLVGVLSLSASLPLSCACTRAALWLSLTHTHAHPRQSGRRQPKPLGRRSGSVIPRTRCTRTALSAIRSCSGGRKWNRC